MAFTKLRIVNNSGHGAATQVLLPDGTPIQQALGQVELTIQIAPGDVVKGLFHSRSESKFHIFG